MNKNYQTIEFDATMPGPASVALALTDIAETMREGPVSTSATACAGFCPRDRDRQHQASLGGGRWVTENTTMVTDLLIGPHDRGLGVTRPVLVVIEGANVLVAAVNPGVRPPDVRPPPTAQPLVRERGRN